MNVSEERSNWGDSKKWFPINKYTPIWNKSKSVLLPKFNEQKLFSFEELIKLKVHANFELFYVVIFLRRHIMTLPNSQSSSTGLAFFVFAAQSINDPVNFFELFFRFCVSAIGQAGVQTCKKTKKNSFKSVLSVHQ